MKDRTTKVFKVLIQVLLGFLFVFLLIIGISAFFFTSSAEDMSTQVAVIHRDSIWGNLLGLLLFYTIFALVVWWVNQKQKKRKNILLFLVLGWYLAAGLLLEVFGRTVPAADSMSVYSLAEALAGGDMSVIHPVESYISFYPQQIGLVAFYELCIRIWNLLHISLAAFHFLKCINVLLACLLVFFQYQTVHLLFGEDRIDCFYLCLVGANLPLLFYTSFVYGEVPSLAFFFLGIWALLKCPTLTGKGKIGFAVLSTGALSISVLLRKNTLIPILALLLVLLFTSLQTQNIRILLFTLVLGVVSFSMLPMVEAVYESRSGNEIAKGVPPLTYLAMGMQEASRGNGWYNGFNLETYQENQMNTAKTNAASLEAIQKRMEEFQGNPGYAMHFYQEKFLTQWVDGTYACRQATLATFGGRSPFFEKIYDGAYSFALIAFCNGYQNILYLGGLIFTFFYGKKTYFKEGNTLHKGAWRTWNLFPLVGLVAVFGGFLFHMLWEANARYIFLYEIMLLPYAAWGCAYLNGRLLQHKQN
jgi:hypothetical protein